MSHEVGFYNENSSDWAKKKILLNETSLVGNPFMLVAYDACIVSHTTCTTVNPRRNKYRFIRIVFFFENTSIQYLDNEISE